MKKNGLIAKLRDYLEQHESLYELVRYVIAGGLTTVLSMLISYGVEFILAEKASMENGFIRYLIDSVNNANEMQCVIANCVSWVIAVLFAYWINRVMVFRAKGQGDVLKGLLEFAGSRLVSFLLFEEGLMLLLKAIGITNIVNRLLVLIVVMIFNYVVSKLWIFKKKPETDNTKEER